VAGDHKHWPRSVDVERAVWLHPRVGLFVESRLHANSLEDALLETVREATEVCRGLLLRKVNGPNLGLFQLELVLSLKDIEKV
jgi:hypothetical protein